MCARHAHPWSPEAGKVGLALHLGVGLPIWSFIACITDRFDPSRTTRTHVPAVIAVVQTYVYTDDFICAKLTAKHVHGKLRVFTRRLTDVRGFRQLQPARVRATSGKP